ncbi:MAG: YbjN domain-containing protein [Planctomycetota bacterium]
MEQILEDAGLGPTMSEDAATGAPVANARLGEITFWVRALVCAGAPKRCENLVLFANFELGRGVSPTDYRIVNRFNDSQVFGRAYVIESNNQVGVDYVIELGGGVSPEHVAQNVSRWADVVSAFVASFSGGDAGS